ncbi:thioesterase II family protein [Amycolatopsis sp. NPDC059090]|uniref:thioesterase II family protein n=1 Tax=Amycolatopsis sp. NPDC059090 TaxID=3346723 RepID=UPI00366DCF31
MTAIRLLLLTASNSVVRLREVPMRPSSSNPDLVMAFPPAGGSEAAFAQVFKSLDDLETSVVRYPVERHQLLSRIAGLDDRAGSPKAGRAIAVIGASLGAVAAVEAVKLLEGCGITVSCALVLSAVAPHCRQASLRQEWSDADLLDLVERASGDVPQSFSSPEVRSYAFDRLRRDLEWGQSRPALPRNPLRCPLIAIRGQHDALVSAPEGTTEWAQWTHSQFTTCTVPGGSHFFFGEPIGALSVTQALRSCLKPKHVFEESE